MINRIWFAVSQAYKHKVSLKRAAQAYPIKKLSELSQLLTSIDDLEGLVLDFDGVLAPHGEQQPNKKAVAVLTHLIETYPNLHYFILSNKPNLQRRAYFLSHFPKIKFIRATQKKPYPDGLQYIKDKYHISETGLAIVDDRILTGGLAAVLAGVKWIYLYPAVQNYPASPFKEWWFAVLRSLERLWIL